MTDVDFAMVVVVIITGMWTIAGIIYKSEDDDGIFSR